MICGQYFNDIGITFLHYFEHFLIFGQYLGGLSRSVSLFREHAMQIICMVDLDFRKV